MFTCFHYITIQISKFLETAEVGLATRQPKKLFLDVGSNVIIFITFKKDKCDIWCERINQRCFPRTLGDFKSIRVCRWDTVVEKPKTREN